MTHVNLLPMRWRSRQMLGRWLALWAPIWVACLAVCSAMCVTIYSERNECTSELNIARHTCGPLLALQSSSARHRRQLKKLKEQLALIAQLEDKTPVYSLLGLLSQSAKECSGRIRVDRLSFSQTRPAPKAVGPMPPAPGKPGEAPEPDGVKHLLQLSGVAQDNLAISQLVSSLRDSRLFDRVDLKSASGAGSGALRSYSIECAF